MSDVVDLLSRRQQKGEPGLHFTSAVEALAYATTQVRDLQARLGSSLVLTADELQLPLAQTAAILAEVTRLHANIREEHA